MNLKLRLKNKATLTALLLCMIAFAYQLCGIIGVVPPVSKGDVTQLIGVVVNLLVGLGVLVDPTTEGISDSAQAMEYEIPNNELLNVYTDDGRDETDL